jgi:hypothetical protein
VSYSAQADIICCCLGAANDDLVRAALRELSAADWDDLVWSLNRHSLAPLFYSRLQRGDLESSVPDGTYERLRRIYLSNLNRNVRLYHSIKPVIEALRDGGMPVIALKGVHLAENVYHNLALRPMDDVDLMVRKDDLPLAAKRLIAMGFTAPGYVGPDLDCSVHQHLAAFSKMGIATIEIHWTIANPNDPFEIDTDGLWERACGVTIGGIELLGLSPEDSLLYSCIHAAYQHKCEKAILPLYDILEIIRRSEQELNWSRFLLLTARWKANRCTYVMLAFARELLNAVIPEGVLRALKPCDVTENIMALFRAKILCGTGETTPLNQRLAQMGRAETFQSKIAVILRSIFPPPNFLAWMYPVSPCSKKIYWYYLVHLRDLFLRHSGAARNLLLHSGRMAAEIARQRSDASLIGWLSMS